MNQRESSATPTDRGDEVHELLVDAAAAAVTSDKFKVVMVAQQSNDPRGGNNEALSSMAQQNAVEQAAGQQAAVGSNTNRPEHKNTKLTMPPPMPHAAMAMACGPDDPDRAMEFELSDSPEQVKRRRPSSSPRARSSPTTSRASTPPRGRRGGSPYSRPLFPNGDAAMHKLVPFDPSASGEQQLLTFLAQGKADREHMAVLKAAMEDMHNTQQEHAENIEHNARRGDEQVLINRRLA